MPQNHTAQGKQKPSRPMTNVGTNATTASSFAGKPSPFTQAGNHVQRQGSGSGLHSLPITYRHLTGTLPIHNMHSVQCLRGSLLTLPIQPPKGAPPPFLIADCNDEPTVTSAPKKDFPWQNYF